MGVAYPEGVLLAYRGLGLGKSTAPPHLGVFWEPVSYSVKWKILQNIPANATLFVLP